MGTKSVEPDDDNHANPDNLEPDDGTMTETVEDRFERASDTWEKSHMSQKDVDDYNKK